MGKGLPEALRRIEESFISETKYIDLSGLELTRIPYEVTKLDYLELLDLAGNQIRKIENLGNLNKLLKLSLGENNISKLEGLDNLQRLNELFLHSNSIEKITGLDNLKNLVKLDLHDNRISRIEGLDYLQNLNELFLQSNRITSIEGLDNLQNLSELFLQSNRIASIEGLDNLQNLSELFLQSNGITSIKGLDNLKKLITLNLRNNLITDIQNELGLLKKINKIVLEGNPLEYPPIEVFNKGLKTVKRYIKEAKRSGIANVNAAKVLLTGSGEVGKTSLRIKLMDRKATLPEKDARTKKVDVDQYKFQKTIDEENFTAFIWDFGGQQIIHHFHRFFMNKSALYILITETSRDDDHLDYWLQTIQMYGKESPILFVQNQMNGIPKSLDIQPFKAHFNIQDNVYKVDLLKNQGLDDLERAIQYHLQSLSFTKRTVPTSWFNINIALQKEAKANNSYFITFDRFREICKEIAEITNKDSIYDIANFLHQLGSILWYAQNPLLSQKVILERHWATEGIFKIIFDESISKTGKFSRKEAEKIWEYDEAFCYHTVDLIEMMKEFKICIQTRSDPNQFLIPALLTELEPKNIKWQDLAKRLVIEYQYEPILPRGLVNHLSAEMSDYIKKDEHVWNTGVWLNDTNSQAKVTENRFKRKIKIELAGESYRELFGVINSNMTIIQKDYGGLSYKLMIPCTCDFCSMIEIDERQFYAYGDLLRRKEHNNTTIGFSKTTIECAISYKDVPIEELLDNIENSKKANTIKIFISYTQEDLQFREKLEQQLKPFLRNKQFHTIWADHQILPGQNWDSEIESNLKTADLVFLLISDDFFTSDYIDEKELPIIIKKKYQSKNCKVIPILVRPSAHWVDSDWSFLQAIPKVEGKLKPISQWGCIDLAWKTVTDEIRRVL